MCEAHHLVELVHLYRTCYDKPVDTPWGTGQTGNNNKVYRRYFFYLYINIITTSQPRSLISILQGANARLLSQNLPCAGVGGIGRGCVMLRMVYRWRQHVKKNIIFSTLMGSMGQRPQTLHGILVRRPCSLEFGVSATMSIKKIFSLVRQTNTSLGLFKYETQEHYIRCSL